MTTKRYRTKEDDCLDCAYYMQSCDGNNKFEERRSKANVVHCANKREKLSFEEVIEEVIEEIIAPKKK